MNARKPTLLRPFLLALTLAVGFGLAWCVLVIWIGNTLLEMSPRRQVLRQTRESLVVTTDGTPLIQQYTLLPRLGQVTFTYRDLAGGAHEAVDGDHMAPTNLLPGVVGWSVAQPSWYFRLKQFTEQRGSSLSWYFIHDGHAAGAGHFVAYNRRDNRLFGYIGLGGFRTGPVPPEERFPVSGRLLISGGHWSSLPDYYARGDRPAPRFFAGEVPPHLVHVPSGNRLRVVDLATRSVSTVFEAPEPIVAVGVPAIAAFAGGRHDWPRPILVRTEQKIYKLDHQYKIIGVFILPAGAGRISAVTWHDLKNGEVFVAVGGLQSSRSITASGYRETVYHLAPDGTVRSSFEVVLQTGDVVDEPWQVNMGVVGLPSPAILACLGVIMSATSDFEGGRMAAFSYLLAITWPFLLAVLAVFAVLTVLTWRRTRAFGYSRRGRWVWTLFVLFVGVPAWVSFMVHRRWPVRLPCPTCHERSPRDREACAACGTTFPAPEPKGIEIFA